jgi:hypothetical protein
MYLCSSDTLTVFKIIPGVDFFVGTGIHSVYTDDIQNIKLSPSYSLWKKTGAYSRRQLFAGYELGVQYVF